jgi:hypothetical protein
VREGQLRRAGELVGSEPAQLDEVVARPRLAPPSSCPGEAEYDPAVVRLEPEAEKLDRLDLERRLFPDFAA